MKVLTASREILFNNGDIVSGILLSEPTKVINICIHVQCNQEVKNPFHLVVTFVDKDNKTLVIPFGFMLFSNQAILTKYLVPMKSQANEDFLCRLVNIQYEEQNETEDCSNGDMKFNIQFYHLTNEGRISFEGGNVSSLLSE